MIEQFQELWRVPEQDFCLKGGPLVSPDYDWDDFCLFKQKTEREWQKESEKWAQNDPNNKKEWVIERIEG